jgi:crotonobetainyl-CoA:carnitine CoA-transferase CaiB-like acyl-CoA transferase
METVDDHTREMTLGTAKPVFESLRVLDLSRWVAGEMCTKLFGDFGAEVLKIELPGVGSLTRRAGPFLGDRPHPEKSALFLHLNTNKRSMTLDLSTTSGRDIFLKLVERSDLLVESFRPGSMEALGIGPSVLREVNPSLAITRISSFGQTGQYRSWEASEIVLEAMGGPMNATGAASRAPQRKPGHLSQYVVGRFAALASLGSLTWTRRTGLGNTSDVSAHESLLAGADRRAPYLVTASYSGVNAPRGPRSAHRPIGTATFTGPYPAKDGYVMVYITTQVFWDRMIEMIAGSDDSFIDRFSGRSELSQDTEWPTVVDRLKEWLSARTKLEVMDEAERRRITITALLDVGEVFHHEHFRSRGMYVYKEHPDSGGLEYVGPPWRMRGGWSLRQAAPRLGEHTVEVLSDMGLSSEEIDALYARCVI